EQPSWRGCAQQIRLEQSPVIRPLAGSLPRRGFLLSWCCVRAVRRWRRSALASWFTATRYLWRLLMPTIFAAQMLKSSLKGRAEMVLVRFGSAADILRFVEIAAHSATAAQWNEDQYMQLFAPSPVQPRLTLVVEEDGQVVGFIVER